MTSFNNKHTSEETLQFIANKLANTEVEPGVGECILYINTNEPLPCGYSSESEESNGEENAEEKEHTVMIICKANFLVGKIQHETFEDALQAAENDTSKIKSFWELQFEPYSCDFEWLLGQVVAQIQK